MNYKAESSVETVGHAKLVADAIRYKNQNKASHLLLSISMANDKMLLHEVRLRSDENHAYNYLSLYFDLLLFLRFLFYFTLFYFLVK